LWGADLPGNKQAPLPTEREISERARLRVRASRSSPIKVSRRKQPSVFIAAGEADAAAFGKLHTANPDLVERFRRKAPLNPLNSATIYSGDASGYIDYPILDTWKGRA
jgi:2,4-dienoyl-CoA reductase-like NADH-dependent reductase (Old Yellow Enzyme family)